MFNGVYREQQNKIISIQKKNNKLIMTLAAIITAEQLLLQR